MTVSAVFTPETPLTVPTTDAALPTSVWMSTYALTVMGATLTTREGVVQSDPAVLQRAGQHRVPERPEVGHQPQLDARRGMQIDEVAHRLGRAERGHADLRHHGEVAKGPEGLVRQPVPVHGGVLHRGQPPELDRMDAVGPRPEQVVRTAPGARPRAVAREPVQGSVVGVDGPHERRLVRCGGGDVRLEAGNGGVFREMEDDTGHPAVNRFSNAASSSRRPSGTWSPNLA